MKLLFIAMTLASLTASAAVAPAFDSAAFLPQLPPDPAEGVVMYPLPKLLVADAGAEIKTAVAWEASRPAILRRVADHVYGHAPATRVEMAAALREAGAHSATLRRRQVELTFTSPLGSAKAMLLILEPAGSGPHPVFVALNLGGNPAVARDAAILPSASTPNPGAYAKPFVAQWPLERFARAGVALVIVDAADFFPDVADGYPASVQRLFPAEQRGPGATAWGAVATWAWGLSRVADYLETDAAFDRTRLAVVGHSRLGKAALWAGATDPRFRVVISNESGCGGAALSKRIFGETVQDITRMFPHWFCGNFPRYGGNEGSLPVDQHQLLALIAPRALYVASASKDLWADPRGEFMALVHAAPVFALYPAGTTRLGYHLRPGEHDLLDYDWERYLAFAQAQWN